MKTCEQTKGLSVYQHGKMVQNYTFDLINHLRECTNLTYDWKLPEWITEEKDYILQNLLSDEIIDEYTLYHDIGKPFCLSIDEDGKRHFPNHANVSEKIYLEVFDNLDVAYLIKHDMDLHLIKSIDVDEWYKVNKKYAITLLIVALSEVHANASMFGGINSTSFKIKLKTITQRGKQIIKLK